MARKNMLYKKEIHPPIPWVTRLSDNQGIDKATYLHLVMMVVSRSVHSIHIELDSQFKFGGGGGGGGV